MAVKEADFEEFRELMLELIAINRKQLGYLKALYFKDRKNGDEKGTPFYKRR